MSKYRLNKGLDQLRANYDCDTNKHHISNIFCEVCNFWGIIFHIHKYNIGRREKVYLIDLRKVFDEKNLDQKNDQKSKRLDD